MEVPMSSLMKKILSENKKTEENIKKKLCELDFSLLNLNWPLEFMEKYFLNDLEKLIETGDIKKIKLKKLFNEYISFRNILASEKGVYSPIPINHNEEYSLKLHYNKYDIKFENLKKLALEKGYDLDNTKSIK